MDASTEPITPEAPDNGRAERARKAVREGYETAKEKVVEGYEKVSHKAHEVWDKTADKSLNDVVHAVNDYVRHKPGKCILMAAGAGLVLGMLLRGRRG
jgi:ElaB/YqjD/DUF883 family membrane-anchored ribosome-binding protein